jgi:alkanesulfonate monooxygenase SsuD/methylene tetrahydromethanopterin reductase-like flavin-dependent oxidoreductase (luciferase family)
MVEDHRDGPRFMIERGAAATRARLDLLSVGDHHATGPASYVQNVPIMARLLAHWGDGPAGCLFLLPVWHPLIVAEQVGTLASMAKGGPFVIQTGLGRVEMTEALGFDRRGRAARLDDSIDVIGALLAGETVSDERWGLRDVTIAPLPPSGFEWWIGGSAPVAIERAAAKGDAWYCDAGVDAEAAATQMQTYLEACERIGREPGKMAIRKDVFIAESHDAATEVGDELIAAGYRGMGRGAVAYGDPESVAEQLAVFGALGFTDVIIRTMAVPQPAAVVSIELSGRVRELLASA